MVGRGVEVVEQGRCWRKGAELTCGPGLLARAERGKGGARPQAWWAAQACWAAGSEKKVGGLQVGRVSRGEELAGLRWGGGADRGELGRKRERRGVWVLFWFF
jgi:hypothetical protein